MLQISTNLIVSYVLMGTGIGFLLGWLLAKLRLLKDHVSKQELEQQYVAKSLYENLLLQSEEQKNRIATKEEQLNQLTIKLATNTQKNQQLIDQLEQQQWEATEWHEQSQNAFEVLANKLLEEKSLKFTQQNWIKLSELLNPLREKIKTFEEQVEKKFIEETRDRVSLKKELEHLKNLNLQLSNDANNLANALRNNSKIQGDWGELQLQLLLEKAGLSPNLHFQMQSSFKDIEGKYKRPDCIIHLPNERHLIIDSKVSLRAFERYFNTENQEERQVHLKEHISALKQHVKDLGAKKYQRLYQINAPDYVLMFIPIESALLLAQQQEKQLFLDALDHNIVMVSNSTLLATIRTIAHIWQQEKQKTNVLEIARQSGLLYDKFCAFVNDLQEIGHKINQANQAYQKAMQKLTEGKRAGETLIGRVEKIKKLGAKASKQLPNDLLPE